MVNIISNIHYIHYSDWMWEVNNYHMTSIESRTIKTLMNLRVLTTSKYPFAFRFIQVPSIMFHRKVQPTTTETWRLYIPWLHPCGITHTQQWHLLGTEETHKISVVSTRWRAKQKREDQRKESPPALDKGPSRSASKSSTIIWIKSCWGNPPWHPARGSHEPGGLEDCVSQKCGAKMKQRVQDGISGFCATVDMKMLSKKKQTYNNTPTHYALEFWVPHLNKSIKVQHIPLNHPELHSFSYHQHDCDWVEHDKLSTNNWRPTLPKSLLCRTSLGI